MGKLNKPNSSVASEVKKRLSKPERPTEVSPKTEAPYKSEVSKKEDPAKPKSYSLRASTHQWLVQEAIRCSVKEGKSVSASRVLSDIVEGYRIDQEQEG